MEAGRSAAGFLAFIEDRAIVDNRVWAGSSNPAEQLPLVGSHFHVNPANTAIRCVVNLTIQYMLIYTALAVARTFADTLSMDYEQYPVAEVLQTAALTVNFAPMLAVLFLGVRMRVTFLSRGTANPPEGVQVWMHACTFAVLAMTVICLVVPLMTGELVKLDPKTGDIDPDYKPFENQVGALLFTALKFIIMGGFYVGVIAIIYGTIAYEPPKGLWKEVPPVSPPVACVMILSCTYFLVYAGVVFVRTLMQFTKLELTVVKEAMLTATNSMNLAPMLSVLFIAARMRALQMDPSGGPSQPWVQFFFYMCTYAVLAQTVVSVAVPVVLGGEVKQGAIEGDMEYDVESEKLAKALVVGRYVILFCIYAGSALVIVSIFTMEHPQGPQYTPPISVTMQCVINLTVQYFFVYLLLFAGMTAREFDPQYDVLILRQTMENAKATIQFCPMLAILFVATRMWALQLTHSRGAPQGWVQDGMHMATWAVFVQFVMVCLVPCVTGKSPQCDVNGNVQWEPQNVVALTVIQTIRWLAFVFLYGGTLVVIAGVYSMTPETANGRGALPVIGWVLPEPLGVNDVVDGASSLASR